MITVPLDFTTGFTKIPNAISKNASELDNNDLLDVIQKEERELLLLILGESQYEALKLELETSLTEPFASLVNGSGKWIGLKSMCKNLVFCKYLDFMEVSVTTTGAGKSKVKNHSVTDYNQKYVTAWNELVNWMYDLEEYLEKTEGLEVPEDYHVFTYKNQFGL